MADQTGNQAFKPSGAPVVETSEHLDAAGARAPAVVVEPAVAAPVTAAEETPPTGEGFKVIGAVNELQFGADIREFVRDLPEIISAADHKEIWGVELLDSDHAPTMTVLEKFLRANNRDVSLAKAQLIAALKWRKENDPRGSLEKVMFDHVKFGGMGYVSVYPKTETHGKEIITWNIYGCVKDKQATFGNVKDFVQWRAALMELAVQQLNLASIKKPLLANEVDPHRIIQVHDYNNLSFLRMDPTIKAASKQVIDTMSLAYPELLKEKYFVNIPFVMGWVFAAMKLFLSAETVKKFHPLSYGSSLAGEMKGWGDELPTIYGGKGKDVTEGLTVKYTDAGTDGDVEIKTADEDAQKETAVKE